MSIGIGLGVVVGPEDVELQENETATTLLELLELALLECEEELELTLAEELAECEEELAIELAEELAPLEEEELLEEPDEAR